MKKFGGTMEPFYIFTVVVKKHHTLVKTHTTVHQKVKPMECKYHHKIFFPLFIFTGSREKKSFKILYKKGKKQNNFAHQTHISWAYKPGLEIIVLVFLDSIFVYLTSFHHRANYINYIFWFSAS